MRAWVSVLWGFAGGVLLTLFVLAGAFRYIPTPQEIFRDLGSECRLFDEHKTYECLVAVYTHSLSDFTKYLFLATVVLGIVGAWQGFLGVRQIRLARDEFTSTHRPRLIVRQFQVDPISVDHVITIHFSVVNVGNTAAMPRLIGCEVALWNGTYFAPPGIDPVQKSISRPPIAGGERVTLTAQSRFVVTQQLLHEISTDQWTVQILGEITYADALNTSRRTGFRRSYERRADNFTPSPNPDQEYCD